MMMDPKQPPRASMSGAAMGGMNRPGMSH